MKEFNKAERFLILTAIMKSMNRGGSYTQENDYGKISSFELANEIAHDFGWTISYNQKAGKFYINQQ